MSSGISWEDGNADILIDVMKEKNVIVTKICPRMVDNYLSKLTYNGVEHITPDLIAAGFC